MRYHFCWPHWHNWHWKIFKRKQSSFKQIRDKEFAKNVYEFLLQQDWYSADNSGNIALENKKSSTVLGVSFSVPEHNIYREVSQSGSFCNIGHKYVREDQIFKEPHEIPSNYNRGALPKPCKSLENIPRKNINRLIFAQLNNEFSVELVLFTTTYS